MTKALGCGIAIVGLLVLVGFHGRWAIQRTGRQRAGGLRRLGAGGEHLPAARRPDSQPGGDGQGLGGVRTGDPAGGRRGAQPRRPGQRAGDRADSEQPREVRPVPAGAGRPLLGALPAAGGGGAVSGVEVDGRLRRPHDAARRDREPDHRRAHALQRGGTGVQHPARRSSRPTCSTGSSAGTSRTGPTSLPRQALRPPPRSSSRAVDEVRRLPEGHAELAAPALLRSSGGVGARRLAAGARSSAGWRPVSLPDPCPRNRRAG